MSKDNDHDVAIIGMALDVPGASDVDSFWGNLVEGRESISWFTEKELLESGVPRTHLADPNYVRARGILSPRDGFDLRAFRISPREALQIDPQHRLLGEVCWHALDSAAYDSERYPRSIGLFGGVGLNKSILDLARRDDVVRPGEGQGLVFGNDKDFAAAHVAYWLDLRGPVASVQTACSTSLVAVHLACQSLLAGECDMALAAGASIYGRACEGYFYQRDGILSPDGHCRALDTRAQGTVPGDGAAAVLLKRRADAEMDGDHIFAIIKGTAVNNDGHGKVGFAAPSLLGQAAVIREALAVGGIDAETVGYVETHGTGTALGDKVELGALRQALTRGGASRRPWYIGSVKTNVGHLDAAAGVVGLIKAALCSARGRIPSSLHFERMNDDEEGFARLFTVPTEAIAWPEVSGPRRAGVSSFGIGGTNAHVVVEQPPLRPPSASAEPHQLLVFSATGANGLRENISGVRRWLDDHADVGIADVAFSLETGRRQMPVRAGIVVGEDAELGPALDSLSARVSSATSDEPPRCVVLFSGLAEEEDWPIAPLYRQYSEFRDAADECLKWLARRGIAFTAEMLTSKEMRARAPLVDELSTFVLQTALASMWRAWGLTGDAVMGYGSGEIAAACFAGVMSIGDAVGLILAREAALAGCSPGALLSVAMNADNAREFLGDGVELAGIDADDCCLLAGPPGSIERLETTLRQRKIAVRRIRSRYALHSSSVAPVAAALSATTKAIHYVEPRIPYLSGATGDWARSEVATSEYWANLVRNPIRFAAGCRSLQSMGRICVLEVGRRGRLAALARDSFRRAGLEVAAWGSPSEDLAAPPATVLETARRLWELGTGIDLGRVRGVAARHRLPLPGMPFERSPLGAPKLAAREPLSTAAELGEEVAFFRPIWARTSRLRHASPAADGGDVVLLGHGDALTRALERELVARSFHVRLWENETTGGKGPRDLAALLDREERRECDYLISLLRVGVRPKGHGIDPAAIYEATVESVKSSIEYFRALGGRVRPRKQFVIVSAGSADVLGDECLACADGGAEGVDAVARIEYPEWRIKSVDIPESAEPTSELVRMLADELWLEDAARVALRGAARFVRHFERRAPARAPAPALKRSGTYVITGGNGGIGGLLANHLRSHFDAKVALLSRSGAAQADAPRSEALPDAECRQVEQALEEVCAVAFRRFLLKELGTERASSRWSLAELAGVMGVHDEHRQLLSSMLRNLVEVGAAEEWQGAFHLTDLSPPLLDRATTARRAHPRFAGAFDLLEHCIESYSRVFRGERQGLEVLYPGGTEAFVQSHLDGVPEHTNRIACCDAVAARLAQLSRKRSAPLRILEVGGGSRILTDRLLPHLPAGGIEYWFTDRGSGFVARAKEALGDSSAGLVFRKFDITRDAAAQGIPVDYFHAVVALDVLHVAPKIGPALEHLRRTLRPDGLLLAVESVRQRRWVDAIWGLTREWWSFEDSDVRHASPLLSSTQWVKAAGRAGWARPLCVSCRVGERDDWEYALLIAEREEHARELDRAGAARGETIHIRADVTRADDLERALAQTLRQFGRIDGIFHAAGSTGGGAIETGGGEVERVLRSKVLGALRVLAASAPYQPGFVALFSSKVGMAGSFGHAAYAAANRCLDFLALDADRGATHVVSIGWDRWRGTGMAVDVESDHQRRTGSALPGGMTPDQCLHALDDLLALPDWSPQVLVGDIDAGAAADDVPIRPPEALAHSSPLARGSPAPVAPSLSASSSMAPGGDKVALVQRAWALVLGREVPDQEASLLDLGGDSMTALQIVAEIRRTLGVDLSLAEFMSRPTLGACLHLVRTRHE